uniref:hypothetical protein n=1 Tax=Salmonella sp. s58408 TaxID=3159701 RepID=UPI00397ED0EA
LVIIIIVRVALYLHLLSLGISLSFPTLITFHRRVHLAVAPLPPATTTTVATGAAVRVYTDGGIDLGLLRSLLSIFLTVYADHFPAATSSSVSYVILFSSRAVRVLPLHTFSAPRPPSFFSRLGCNFALTLDGLGLGAAGL